MTETEAHDTRLGAYALIMDPRDRVLLVRLRNTPAGPARWTLPGGGVELHETLEQALHRELLEETGHTVRLDALLGVDTVVIDGARRVAVPGVPIKFVRVIYRATVTGGTLRHETDGSSDMASWIAPDRLETVGCLSLVHAAMALHGG